MRRRRLALLLAAACLVPRPTVTAGVGPTVYSIEIPGSRILVQVGKTGMFGFAGHAHEVVVDDVHGRITFDPADPQHAGVRIEIPTASLRVNGTGEPPADVPEVQKVMQGERVLDVQRYPTIVFSSRRIVVSSVGATAASATIDGDLTLHGVTRPISIKATLAFDAGGRIAARGSFVVKQTDFGMEPVSALGGTVRVKDELDITFELRTRPSNGDDHAQ